MREPRYSSGNVALLSLVNKNFVMPAGIKKEMHVEAFLLVTPDSIAKVVEVKGAKGNKVAVEKELKRILKLGEKWIPGGSIQNDGSVNVQSMIYVLQLRIDPENRFGMNTTHVTLKKPGTLSQLLSSMQQDTCSCIAVHGKLNSTDIITLRQMAGANNNKHGNLQKLDLFDAKFVTDSIPYLSIESAEKEMFAMIHREISRVDSKGYHVVDSRDFAQFSRKNTYTESRGPYDVVERTRDEGKESFSLRMILYPSGSRINQPFDWKSISKYRIGRWRGHCLSRSIDGSARYEASTSKNNFCFDMFFKCPHLTTIVLPQKSKIDETVSVYEDTIHYIDTDENF